MAQHGSRGIVYGGGTGRPPSGDAPPPTGALEVLHHVSEKCRRCHGCVILRLTALSKGIQEVITGGPHAVKMGNTGPGCFSQHYDVLTVLYYRRGRCLSAVSPITHAHRLCRLALVVVSNTP